MRELLGVGLSEHAALEGAPVKFQNMRRMHERRHLLAVDLAGRE